MSGKSTDPFAEFNEPSTDDHGQLFDHPLSAARKPTASSGLMEAHTTISSTHPAGAKAASVDSVSKAAPSPITFEPVPSPSASDDDNFQENEFWVKLLIQGNTHRVKLSQKSFAELSQAASNAALSASQAEAKTSENAVAPVLVFKYVDEEGEMVSINSDADLRDAFTISNKYRMVLKVTVINTAVAQNAEKKEVEVPTLMKAAFYRQYGPIDKTLQFMQEWPVPKITQPNQVLIRIHASAINPIDVRMLAGDMSFMHMIKPFPIVPGFDVSGVVVKAGLYCRRLKPGDQVYGLASFRRLGTFAEYVVMEEDEASLKPANLTHAEAASLPMVAITGYRALVLSARLDKGQKILILGGSGGCGSFGIQLAKWVGAHVVVTCSSRNMELCKQLGADEVIDYTDPGTRWWDVLKGQDFDVIYDTVGGADSWQQSTQVLKKKEGKYVTIAGDTASGEESKWTVKSIFQRGAAIASRKFMSLFGGNKYEFVVGATASYPILDSVRELCVTGFVKPVIDTLYQIEDCQLIFERCAEGHTRGKSVISLVSEREDDRYPRYFHDNSGDKAAPSDKLPSWMPEPGQAASSAAAQRPIGERFRPSGRDLNEHGGSGYGDDDL